MANRVGDMLLPGPEAEYIGRVGLSAGGVEEWEVEGWLNLPLSFGGGGGKGAIVLFV